MAQEHLTYFKVENFKRFDTLELTDIGQFNLIVGDNNVGKTSLLEAISVVSRTEPNIPYRSEIIANLGHTIYRRNIVIDQNVDLFFKYLSHNLWEQVGFNFRIDKKRFAVFARQSQNTREQMEFSFLEGDIQNAGWGLTHLGYKTKNPSLIPANIEVNDTLVTGYQEALGLSMSNKRLIISNLTSIDKHIVEIEVLPVLAKNHVMIGFDNRDLFMPITAMGESAVRVFYYLLHIIKNSNQRLLIDEIDTGIHYSRLKKFLKNIVQIAEKNGVQLFMTTHSLECQQLFVELFEDPDMLEHQSKARQFTLIEKPDGQVVVNTHNFKQLQHALEIGFETRGGKPGW